MSIRHRNCLRLTATCLAIFILASALGACKKEEEPTTRSDGTNKTTVATKTTQKSTASIKDSTSTSANVNFTNNFSTSNTSSKNVLEIDTENKATDGDSQTEIAGEQLGDNWGVEVVIELEEKFASDDIDLKGRTLTVDFWSTNLIPEDSPDKDAGTVIFARRVKAAEEKYNFKDERCPGS